MRPVLYVEDEEDDVFLLQRAWAQAALPNPLVVLPDGAQAIDYLLGRGRFRDRSLHPRPALVLLDLNLPFKGGLEVLAEARALLSAEELPILILSSSDAQRDRAAALSRGANGYRVKPRDCRGFTELAAEISHGWLGAPVVGGVPR